jgi:ATP-dependent DNA ligase
MLEPQPTENIPFLLTDSGILVVKCDVLESQTSVRMPILQAVPAIFSTMQPIFNFCLPTKPDAVPTGPDWLHEVKYDGYRLRLERDGDRVRLITPGGYNWADRYPRIAEAALKNRQKRFVIEVSNPSVGEHPHGGSRDRGRQWGVGNR